MAHDVAFEFAMRRANELSLLGLGLSSPNPIVGAVILDDNNQIIGEGFHQRGKSGVAGAHAEINALNAAKDRARGATLVVTLEPCNHHGKTPPCTDAIISAGIARVIFAVEDPHQIAQGGAQRLKSAGIEVVAGILSEEVAFSNRAWLNKISTKKPFVIAKIAATLDGFVAAADGTSKWITSKPAREDVAQLRQQSDAIVTGTGTVLADDPLLTARVNGLALPPDQQPIRIILGQREIPLGAKIRGTEARTEFMRTRDVQSIIDFANSESLNQILLEAGPTLTSAFIAAGLVDELYLYQAPTLLGAGRTLAGGLKISTLSDRLDFVVNSVSTIGDGRERNIKTHLVSKRVFATFISNSAGNIDVRQESKSILASDHVGIVS